MLKLNVSAEIDAQEVLMDVGEEDLINEFSRRFGDLMGATTVLDIVRHSRALEVENDALKMRNETLEWQIKDLSE